MHFKKPVSKLCDPITAQSDHTQNAKLSCGEQSFSLLEGIEFRVTNCPFCLKISIYRCWMTFQMWNKTYLGNGQISRGAVRRWQEFVSHRQKCNHRTAERKTLWIPPRSYYIHQILPVNRKTGKLLPI